MYIRCIILISFTCLFLSISLFLPFTITVTLPTPVSIQVFHVLLQPLLFPTCLPTRFHLRRPCAQALQADRATLLSRQQFFCFQSLRALRTYTLHKPSPPASCTRFPPLINE